MLVLKQIAGEYKCLNPSLAVYLVAAKNLLTKFRESTWEHILREEYFTTNEMAQIATGVQMPEDCVQMIIKYPTLPSEKRVRIMALNYLMWNGDLVRKSKDEAPSVPMNPVVKPWPFRRWAMDLIGKIYPASSKQHCFIIVATYYFSKWVEAKPVKSTTSQEIITFIEEQIIQRFGIPESITTDRGSSFICGEMLDMAEAFKFKLLQSTRYYAQANGHAESSNKVIINIIKKMLEKNSKQWHEKLLETLWAYRTSKREATGMTPYALTYGHDAIMPMEIAIQSLRIAQQHNLTGEYYSQAMLLELEGLDESRIDTLNKLLVGKQALSRAYNKRVKNKSFEEGEIVWKAVLPLRTHIAGYGKWSPTWENLKAPSDNQETNARL
ncbi:hypothetical protein L3X38_025508 [Prunus dulcis]|uniref:Integrase catalytic domain-containing protein n=1 Tax=Prunus dulcis TaxID=3755 RepID=A0AAD4W1V9_PRUDU|nr:hypothetical protein L3X38_025508 [Prunus dulcis]